MCKVSVIIPIYNVEKYIARCAKSLLEQTLVDIEYIFVDDCTGDNSLDVLAEVLSHYPERLKQVKIIRHKENLGLPLARKTGIDNAVGDYIVHCDSDDWVDTSLYEAMYNSAVTNNADITVCDFMVHRPNKVELKVGTRVTGIEEYKLNLLFQMDPVSVVNKMIRKQVYLNIEAYPTQNMGEDMATTLQLIRFCKQMSFVEGTYYHYDGTTISITREENKQATINRALQACDNAQLIIEAYSKEDDEAIYDGLTHLKFMQRRLLMPFINHEDVYEIWKKTFPEINRDVLFRRSVRINNYERLKFFLTLIKVFPAIKNSIRRK